MSVDLSTLAMWVVIGLIAGSLASHLGAAHGLRLLGGLLLGVLVALAGGLLIREVGFEGESSLPGAVVAFAAAALVVALVQAGTRRTADRNGA
jgi:uncharacterized membrane protein YeaQ/YmgE (transglycosylase-associated protein family)